MKIFLAFVVLLLVVIAASVLVGEQTIVYSQSTMSWPTASGTVTVSKIRETEAPRRYFPTVEYNYSVGSDVFSGSQVRLLDLATSGSQSPDWPRSRIAPYKVGAQIKVFYNPAAPRESILEPRKLNILQAYPKWGFVCTFVVVIILMRQLLVIAPRWVFAIALTGLFICWVWFLIEMRPE